MEPRNFVSVVPAAKKGKLGPIFFFNIRVMYILSVKKQRTGQKMGKNPPKKVFFSSPSDGGAGKTTFIGGFLPVFCPVLCFFTDNLYMKCHFCKKNSVQLTFSSLRTANCKVPSRIGGHHFLLCQQTNTKDIAGQSARGVPRLLVKYNELEV